MKKYLFFDSETTGLLDFKLDLMDPSQPRICQLAAVLTDEEGTHLEEVNAIIKPDGWTVPSEAAAINHLTTEICEEKGIYMVDVLKAFNELKAACTDRVAFNITYDKRMLAREAHIYKIPHDSTDIASHCVMLMATPYCKLPPTDKMMKAGRKCFKTPNLKEAYSTLFGKEFENAHNAFADVIACKEIFFHLKSLKENPNADQANPTL